MSMERTGRQAKSQSPAERVAATFAEGVGRRLWKRGEGANEPRSPDAGSEQRLQIAEARLEHLEAALEALQDALYRHEVAAKEEIDELRRRTNPEQMARDLSRDALRRGL